MVLQSIILTSPSLSQAGPAWLGGPRVLGRAGLVLNTLKNHDSDGYVNVINTLKNHDSDGDVNIIL